MSGKLSGSSSKIIEDNYKLSLKFFMNRNLSKSFSIIENLYENSFQARESEQISEKLFIKIVNLYWIEVGVILKDDELVLSDDEKHYILQLITEGEITKRLSQLYSSERDIPNEILYHIYLVYIIYASLFGKDKWLLKRFEKIYAELKYNSNDDYSEEILHLYIFKVLANQKKFKEAEDLIEVNKFLVVNKPSLLERLEKIKADQKSEEILAKQKEDERQTEENELKKKDLSKSKTIEKYNNLNYKSLRDIRNQYSNGTISPKKAENVPAIKERLLYIANLVKSYVHKNSVVIAMIILFIFAASKLVRTKGIDWRSRIKETMQMAFQVSYL